MYANPRPVPEAPGAGDGRGVHPMRAAARRMTSMPRGSDRPCRRNATPSACATTASMSVKLSTAKQFAILPGARMFDGRSGAVGSQCTTTSWCGTAYGGSPFWLMSPVVIPGVCAMPAASSASRGMLGRLAVACGSHISVRQAAIVPSSPTRALQREQLRRSFGIPAELVLARPLHAHRTGDGPRQQRRVGGGIVMPVHAVTTRSVDIDHPHRLARQAQRVGDRQCGTGAWPATPTRSSPCRRERRRRHTTAPSTHAIATAR